MGHPLPYQVLSRGWCDGVEFNLTRILSPVASYCLPLAQHTSFSDASHWYPGILTRAFRLRGKRETLYSTHNDVALAVAAHILGESEARPEMSMSSLEPLRIDDC